MRGSLRYFTKHKIVACLTSSVPDVNVSTAMSVGKQCSPNIFLMESATGGKSSHIAILIIKKSLSDV